ncbi:selenocysteine-specific translation elongation factor [Salinicola rhizosphaerae]|uniref:Selenocysteine-specific elongation factor n=1 Tax=Salinicola rhizosphaerae TaxID=1443141 RepID=A0ABQ3EAF6_9GAMM|nr:selenocysteine-specific translation elongation factor [Salinicola rhizosphaerae]GHB31663.1 selenocysteine-specific translation factor [Salinicola rhizosphaerae]
MIVGTAGHVDHGKTALIRALTGVQTDRLKEEQARGLTIEPGYAYPRPPAGFDGVSLGFIDVPGHERFIANMLSGAAGIEAMLLVVAADDGIMPQTREHARILELLGVTRAWVALTKIDRVDSARIAAVSADIDAWLAATPFAGAPIFPLSSVSDAGIAALGETLWQTAARCAAPVDIGEFRLAVDRVFIKTGSGVVVTGTVRSGSVNVGETVHLLPGLINARVRGLRAQNRQVARASAGERCAINLSGSEVERSRIVRGDWVVGEHSPVESRLRLDATLRLLPESPPVAHWTPVHLHHASAHVTGRLSLLEGESLMPGQSMLAQLVLDDSLQAVHGDTLIVRDHGASRTLGAARVLDVAPPRRGARKPARLDELRALEALSRQRLDDSALVAFLRERECGETADIDIVALTANLNLGRGTLVSAAERAGWRVLSHGGDCRALSPAVCDSLSASLLACLASIHELEPATRGVDVDRLRRMLVPHWPSPLFRPWLEREKESGKVVQHGPFVALPAHAATLSPEDAARWSRLMPLLQAEPFEPPRVRELAAMLGWGETDTRALLRSVALLGEVYQMRHDHFFTSASVARLAEIVRELDLMSAQGARAAEFRDRIGCGRKLSVTILEFFDRVGFTRRIGDSHRVIRDDMLFE